MPKVISVHEYSLKEGVDPDQFEAALRRAQESDLLRLPGLVGYHFIKGLRGARRAAYAAIWVYESRQAWEALWGPVDAPRPKVDYPENWKTWEDEILGPFLDRDPDKIRFTAYQEL